MLFVREGLRDPVPRSLIDSKVRSRKPNESISFQVAISQVKWANQSLGIHTKGDREYERKWTADCVSILHWIIEERAIRTKYLTVSELGIEGRRDDDFVYLLSKGSLFLSVGDTCSLSPFLRFIGRPLFTYSNSPSRHGRGHGHTLL